MADVVAPANFRQGFPRFPSRQGLSDLMASELELLAKAYPSGLCRFLPSAVLTLINSRSNSARPPRIVSIKRPGGVVVSAQASANI